MTIAECPADGTGRDGTSTASTRYYDIAGLLLILLFCYDGGWHTVSMQRDRQQADSA